MKKLSVALLSLILCIIFATALVACNNSEEKTTEKTESQNTDKPIGTNTPTNTDVPSDTNDPTKDTYTEGLEFTLNNEKNAYSVTGYNGISASVIIPSKYEGLPVMSIGDSAFDGCMGLTSIDISNSVTSIGNSAFFYCAGLTSITIPNSVTSIGDQAFYYCTGLTSIDIPNSVTSIGNSAFSCCEKLTSITVDSNNKTYHSTGNCLIETASKTLVVGCKTSVIPTDGSITSIGNYAFSNCTGLMSIDIPNRVISIGDYAFSNCTGLTSITIPDSVTSIGDDAFSWCEGLTSITVDSNNKTYHSTGNCLIETSSKTLVLGCKTSVIPTDGSVTSIGNDAFSKCTGLTNVSIPNSVTSIGDDAFYYCTGLTSIDIPNSVTSIGNSAFFHCTGLTNITIPNSVTSIGNSAFEFCTGLTSIDIPDSVTSIGNSAFEFCTGLTSIDIPDSVTSIGAAAFAHCDGLTSVTIPNSVTSIGNSAFYECTGLTSIIIPNSVTSIEYQAFYYCTGLTSIDIPNSVTSIGDYAFCYCTGLTNVTIGNGVTTIGNQAFSSCTGLTSVTVDSNNKTYHSSGNCITETASKILVVGCKTSVIPTDGSVTSIGNSAFFYCTGLTNITIPNSVTSIGDYAFYVCTNWKIVFVDSADITSTLTSRDSCGYLIDYAEVVLIKKGIESVGSYVTTNYIFVEEISYKRTAYTSYSMHAHIWAELDEDFDKCSTCGLLKDRAHAEPENTVGGTWGNLSWILNLDTDALSITGEGKMNDFSSTSSTDAWGAYKTSIKTVNIGNGVTSIGDDAFSGCTGLTSIDIPNSVTSIDSGAFSTCTELTSITVDSNNKTYHSNGNCIIETSSKTLVVGCKTSVIPTDGSVTSIGDAAFYHCTGLTSVTIPDSVTSIGNNAFSHCTGLTSITIPKSVTSIGEGVFANCYNLKSITIDSENKTYYSSGNCIIESLTKTIISGCSGSLIPADGSVSAIGNAAFAGAFTSPDDFGKISFVIPEGVTSIGESAFFYCTAFNEITIPNTVKSIGHQAFYNCFHLYNINFIGTKSEWQEITKGTMWFSDAVDKDAISREENLNFSLLYQDKSTGLLFSLNDDEKSYSVSGFKGTKKNIIIPSEYGKLSVTTIENNAFRKHTEIASIIIPNSVTTIGEYAFYDCTGLTSITIPNSVTNIGKSAAFGCYKLVEIVNKSSLNIIIGSTEYGGMAYYAKEVHNKESKIVNENGYLFYTYDEVNYLLGYIGEETVLSLPYDYNGEKYQMYQFAFRDCADFTSITIPDSVTSIGVGAFQGCTGLTSISIPDSVTSIGGSAFNGCTGLTSVTIPDSVTSIGNSAFSGCENITSIDIPDSVTSIGDGAFSNCDGLTSVTIPDSVTSIGNNAFEHCTGLTSITIPDRVTSIGNSAFYYCTGLTSITIPDSITIIGIASFFRCTALTNINFEGTKNQWNAINKDYLWNGETDEYTVHCTDGDISKANS